VALYVPLKGDFIAVSFDPQNGHEQRGHRPALVVSNDRFNAGTGMCVVLPVTNTRRDYPFHVPIPEGGEVTGVVMIEQVRSIDYRSRRIKRIGRAPDSVLDEALAILDACLY
jgi:mRNA interferase MazF